VLPDWLHWVWRAWHRLHQDRPWVGGGMAAPQPRRIPWAAVMAWSDRHGYGSEQADFLDRCCQVMDAVFLDWWQAQQRTGAT
jgi:hypothetical protein